MTGDHLKPRRDRPPPTFPASDEADTTQRPAADRPTVEQMGEWSFPASDPPAVWTWDPKPEALKPPADGREEI
jgi:hypothetical protein